MNTIDVTLWGCTGFTGTLVAEYFATVLVHRIPNLQWALAGRNRQKLESLYARIIELLPTQVSPPRILVGDITDQKSLDHIARQSRVILSTAGPFLKYGLPLVDACVRHECHYTDITGETPFVRQLIDKYHEDAIEKKLIVMPMCGFDSIPSDLGAYFTSKVLAQEAKSPALNVRGYFSSNGGPSGGTLTSGQNMMKHPEIKAQFDQPFLLGGHHVGLGRAEEKDYTQAQFNKEIGAWTAPFGMAQINTRVVRRSTLLNTDLYSNTFSYNEMMVVPNEKLAQKLANPPPPEVVLKLMKAGRLPMPGSGPSAKQRAKSFFGALFVGQAENGHEVLVSLKGGDPGYTETSKMVSEAAIALAFDAQDNPQQRYGVLTPSVAMGDVLIRKLADVGLKFKVQHVPTQATGFKITPKDTGKVFMSFLPSRSKL